MSSYRTICYPDSLAPAFRATLIAMGYAKCGRSSASRFFSDMVKGDILRRKVPIPEQRIKMRRAERAHASVSEETAESLDRCRGVYKSFGHLVEDIVAGNWFKKEQRKEAA